MAKAVSPAMTQALVRLRNAVTSLEAVVSRRAQDDRSLEHLKRELAIMQDDRAQIALDLDGALAKAARLEAVSGELGRRVERATTLVREVMGDLGERD
jgi:predicted  nucleic acid-binding Zn-ribbon protein